MFEVAEIGHKLSKDDFKLLIPELKTRLLEAQAKLAKSNSSVIILISGVEGAGKGAVVNRLNEWMDSRGIETNAFWEETDEQTMRPAYWRFWRVLPARGRIGIMFGSWYTKPVIDKVYNKISKAEYERQLHKISEFETMLVHDDTLLIKLWFHMPKSAVEKQLREDALNINMLARKTIFSEKFSENYERFVEFSERALRSTESSVAPWHIIEATDESYRDATAGQIVLKSLEQHLDKYRGKDRRALADGIAAENFPGFQPTILDSVDLAASLAPNEYPELLQQYQLKLYDLCWQAHNQRKTLVMVFEGWDAAGKGSAIRRVTQAIDARLYKVIQSAAPTDEEAAHHYLWRFWRNIPLAGYVSIYDRSWYGRVLVERVEKISSDDEWKRAYREINHFEEQLYGSDIVVLKFWLHISKDEQLKRFQERQRTPWKQYKLTDDDWRNREKWDAYKEAVNDMVAHTSTEKAPWILIPADDKKFARVEVIKNICKAIEKKLHIKT